DGTLEVHGAARHELAEGAPAQRLRHDVHRERPVRHVRHGEAHAVDGDRVTDLRPLGHPGPAEQQSRVLPRALDGDDRADLLDDPGEHQRSSSAGTVPGPGSATTTTSGPTRSTLRTRSRRASAMPAIPRSATADGPAPSRT